MQLTILHPSRGRAQKAFDAVQQWMNAASGEHDIQHIISLDLDDPQLPEYKKRFGAYILYPNTCVVEAVNHAAKYANGEILIYGSDDFVFPEKWDTSIVKEIGSKINEPCLLKVDDNLQKFTADVCTIPIITKALYGILKYFFNPHFKSMFVDQHIYWVCRNNGWLLEAPDLVFFHEHYCNGKAQKDETYIRSEKNWQQGQQIYNAYKKAGFPIML